MIATMAVSVSWAFVIARAGYSLPAALLIGAAFATIAGILIGTLVAYGDIPPIFATLAGSIIYGLGRTLFFQWEMQNVPPGHDGFDFIGKSRVLGVPVTVNALGAFRALAHFVLTSTRFGWETYAMGSNPNTARTTDLPTRGKPVRFRVPREAVEHGIAYVTEDRKLDGLFENMRIAQNIFLGKLAMGVNPATYATMREARRQSERWIETLKVRAIDKDSKMIELSGGNQQKIVVAKALIQNPSLIIFDGATRGVDVGAICEIHHMIQQLADAGAAVVVISSYLPEILSLSDRILVARQGRIVEEMTVDEATEEKIMYAAVH